MKKKLIFMFLIIATQIVIAQNQSLKAKIDSINKLMANANDTTKVNLYYLLSNLYQGNDNNKIKSYGIKIIEIGKKTGSDKFIGQGYFKIALYYHILNYIDSAKANYITASTYATKSKFFKLQGSIHQNLALIFLDQSDYENSIKENIEAIKIQDKFNNNIVSADLKNNVGIIYLKQKSYAIAESYFNKAINDYMKTNNIAGLAKPYQNLGLIEFVRANYLKSNDYFRKSIKSFNTSNNYFDMTQLYQNMVRNFINLKQVDSAMYYNQLSNKQALVTDNEAGLFLTYINFSILYQRYIIKPELSKLYLDSASKLIYAMSYPEYRMTYFLEKSSYNFCYGDKQKGFEFMDKFIELKDSIFSENSVDIIGNINTKFETEKKEILLQKQAGEIEIKRKENETKNKLLILGSLGLFAIAVFAFIAFFNFKKTKKQNLIINNQKQEVELKNEEITRQKHLVDEKQKEIIDSINYAKRIQQAVLTGEDVWNKISPEHFILFKPKDIVSGDFYWAYNTPNGRSIFALADCTGHGVPGGFMSMLGNSFLNEIVVENKLFKANEILNKLRVKIITALEQKGQTDQKDGMDISLCVWNKLDNTLEFAGANNPLWLLRNNEIMSYTADKMPIGTYLETEKPFTSTTLQLQKNDIIYLTTDGYPDQFGGPKGKKLKQKNMLEMLVNNSTQSMANQKILLETNFNSWKNSLDQIDDVAVIGIKVV